ncbi:MAG: AAA family ATPase [Chitinispirillaceae bacterium]|nr:AAA family ATPase [Chitinispirillaceae bacterium]
MATIAFTGKGGVGKSTIAALAIQWLVAADRTPVLAIDADSNANLNELLGISYEATVGGVREEARAMVKADPGLSKSEYLALQIQKALVERKGYDYLVMGRPEGPGCYCYANNVLRDVISHLSSSYPYLVIDCEAGLEHLSRRTLIEVDWLITVSDQSLRGLRTALRISELADEMKTRVRHRALLINRAADRETLVTPQQTALLADSDFEWIMALPEDDTITAMDSMGGTIYDLPSSTQVRTALRGVMGRLLEEP